ncbi:MAG: hypothetical protein ACYDBB_13310 [Armatimonadota bacterium]
MRFAVLCFTLLLVFGAALAVENQAFLGIFAETTAQKMAGMPEIPAMEGIDLGAMPGMGGMMSMGVPRRLLTVRLWSPNLAPANAFATLAIPAGLKLGPKLNLALYRPEPGKVEGGGAGSPDSIPNFTIKRYWGSSKTVKPGQPEVITWKSMTAEQKAIMREEAQKAQNTSSYYYKPNWTTGYWPTEKQPGTITKDAALPGKYALTTNYTGNVAIDVPATVQFLNPLEMSSPDLKKTIPFEAPIVFKWKPVPGILGYYAFITGMQGKNTLITWSSSEIKTDPGMAWDYLQMAEVAAFVKSTAFMAPDRTEVIVPIGIFKDCDIVSFTMVGYGPGAALDEAQPLPRVQTKTTLTITLGGKMMADMGGMGGGDDE